MAWKDNQSKPHRTCIEDLSAIGDELSEEQLRLVSGGTRSQCPCSSSHVIDFGSGYDGPDSDF